MTTEPTHEPYSTCYTLVSHPNDLLPMKDQLLAYQPAELVPPGRTLVDWLERTGMTQAEFARRTGLTPKHINQVVNGGASISAEVALTFEHVTAIPARYWAQLDSNYQNAKLRAAEAVELEKHVALVDLFPVHVLESMGRLVYRLDLYATKIEKPTGWQPLTNPNT